MVRPLAHVAYGVRFLVMLHLAVLAMTLGNLIRWLAVPGWALVQVGLPDIGDVLALPFIGLSDGCEMLMHVALSAGGIVIESAAPGAG